LARFGIGLIERAPISEHLIVVISLQLPELEESSSSEACPLRVVRFANVTDRELCSLARLRPTKKKTTKTSNLEEEKKKDG
jgi:hypothetical protein